MSQHDRLFAIVEFGVGIAGFAGVAFAVIYRGKLAEVDRFRVTNILGLSLGAAFFAFVPVVLDETGQSPGHTWRITSVLLVTFYVAAGVSLPRRMRAFTDQDRARLSPSFMVFSQGLFLLTVSVLIGNVVGWPFDPQSAPVLLALLFLLLVSAGNFVRLLARPHGDESTA